MGGIRIGTSGWTDRGLIAAGWYPPHVRTPEQRLRYYASQFPLVEVDATYYHPPAERAARLWVERTPEDFTFNVKAFSLFTQHPTRPEALPRDLRPAALEAARQRPYLYLRDTPSALVESMWDRFLSALTPLADSGKLGAILLQFPQWFPPGRTSRRYIMECRRRCAPLRVCVEFRNAGWMSEGNRAETLAFLADNGLAYVCVDMPQGYPSSIPPVAEATADTAVVRFHGRCAQWDSREKERRFRYRYSTEELREWVPKLRRLAERTDTTHVLLNNCWRDDAQSNAQQLSELLERHHG